MPESFWSGWGPWLGGLVAGAFLWIGRNLVKATARASDLDALRAQFGGLDDKLERMHGENIARLAKVEEAQTHMPDIHVVNSMAHRLSAVEIGVSAMVAKIDSIAGIVRENHTDIREVRAIVTARRDAGDD